jgi:hypothetical protein
VSKWFVSKWSWTEIGRLHRGIDQPEFCSHSAALLFARCRSPLNSSISIVVFVEGALNPFELFDQGGALQASGCGGSALASFAGVRLARRHGCCPCTTTNC